MAAAATAALQELWSRLSSRTEEGKKKEGWERERSERRENGTGGRRSNNGESELPSSKLPTME